MACDVSTITTGVASNGYYGLENRSALLAMAGALSISTGLSASQAISGASSSGYYAMEDKSLWQSILAVLCPVSALPCVNVISGLASYGIFDPHPYTVPGLSPNTNYRILSGANEAGYQNEGGAVVTLVNGQIVLFTTGPTATFTFLGIIGNSPITATLCTQ